MNLITALTTRNTLRPVWWSTFDTVSDFGGVKNLSAAIADADHNIKIAGNMLRKVNRNDHDATIAALDILEQAKYNRQILDGIYDDTVAQY